jgi:regulator of sigma E protease
VLFFLCFSIAGIRQPDVSARVEVLPGGAAAAAHLQSGDTVVGVGGTRVANWEAMRKAVVKYPGKATVFDVDRDGKRLQLTITPKADGNEGRIGVTIFYWKISLREAAIRSLETPYEVVRDSLIGLAKIITRTQKADLGGPVRMVTETSKAAESGWVDFVLLLGALSAYLGVFNALPFPALDGGRLAFLTYEAVTRRKPNARIEVMVHTLGFVMLLSLIFVVTFSDIKALITGSRSAAPASSAAAAPSGLPSPAKKP